MKVLMVGLGSIARKHIASLRTIDPSVEIVAWRSSRGGASVEGVQDVYELPRDGFDFAIVCNPTSCHASAIHALLELNIPLYIEKPLFADLEHQDLLEKIRCRGILTHVACDMRYIDTVRYIHDHVQELRVNEVNVYCGSYLPSWRPGTDWRNGYSARPELGGGAHLDLIHELDYLYWIFGKPQRTHKLLRSVSSLEMEAVDYANYIWEYPSFTASVVLNYYRKDFRRALEIVADGATWKADFAAGTVTDGDGRVLFRSTMQPDGDYLAQMSAFVELVRQGATTSPNDVFEAYEVLKLCLE